MTEGNARLHRSHWAAAEACPRLLGARTPLATPGQAGQLAAQRGELPGLARGSAPAPGARELPAGKPPGGELVNPPGPLCIQRHGLLYPKKGVVSGGYTRF